MLISYPCLSVKSVIIRVSVFYIYPKENRFQVLLIRNDNFRADDSGADLRVSVDKDRLTVIFTEKIL